MPNQNENTATFFVDVYGDIFDTLEEAELLGLDGTVQVPSLYVGSLEEMRAAALAKYNRTHSSNVTTKLIDTSETGTRWFNITGADVGTEYEFRADVYGLTTDNAIVDCDNYPLTEGDRETIAVRNSLNA